MAVKVIPSKSKTHRVEYLTVTVEVHAEKYRMFEAHLKERGLDFEEYIARMLEHHKRLPMVFGLDTKFTFGKYRLRKLRDVAAHDPGYIDFCIAEIPGFVLEAAAEDFWLDVKRSIRRRRDGE